MHKGEIKEKYRRNKGVLQVSTFIFSFPLFHLSPFFFLYPISGTNRNRRADRIRQDQTGSDRNRQDYIPDIDIVAS